VWHEEDPKRRMRCRQLAPPVRLAPHVSPPYVQNNAWIDRTDGAHRRWQQVHVRRVQYYYSIPTPIKKSTHRITRTCG
jgi:hypothetical protein